MDRTTKMPRAPLSPRAVGSLAAGTFDTAYLEDGNAQKPAIRRELAERVNSTEAV